MTLVRLLLLPALRLEFKLNTISYKNTAELFLGGIFVLGGVGACASAGQDSGSADKTGTAPQDMPTIHSLIFTSDACNRGPA